MSDLSPPRDPRPGAVNHTSASVLPNVSTSSDSITTQTNTSLTNPQSNLPPGASFDARNLEFRNNVPSLYSNTATPSDPLNLRNKTQSMMVMKFPKFAILRNLSQNFLKTLISVTKKSSAKKSKEKKPKKKRKISSSSEDESSSELSSSSNNSSSRRKRGYLFFIF